MSLNIYFDGVDVLPGLPVKENVVMLFTKVALDGCVYDRSVLESIELGKYLDSRFFIDRFDSKVRIEYLSTGAKAALCLYHCPDVIVSGVEIGRNALTSIIRYCRCGHLLLPASNYYVAGKLEDAQVDVICRGRNFTSLNEFAEYMMEVAPDA